MDAATTAASPASGSSSRSRAVDFRHPSGEPALIAHDSVSWRVFKNPVSGFIGGITAVVLELGEPRVCAGVWNHTTFRTEPLRRLRRTGLAAMVTVYGPRSTAERMIAGIRGMHERVRGETGDAAPYHANDPVLLDWVQATASFGFVEAYSAYVRELAPAQFDAFYAESEASARLYGAVGSPTSQRALDAQFAAMRPHLRASAAVTEFLEIMRRTAILPGPLRLMQGMLVRAAVALVPEWARETLGLCGATWALGAWEARLVRVLGRVSDRIAIPGSPPVEACERLGLPRRYLFRKFNGVRVVDFPAR